MSETKLRVRRSLLEIQKNFDSGKDIATLENLIVAWQFIKALPPSDPNSFFSLGGFHGEPFRGRGDYDAATYWGGYCNHGNILFPTWHRVYLFKLEKALQSVPGCEDVMLPYWDQTYKQTKNGKVSYADIPACLTDEYFTFKTTGVKIPNPLRSFTFPVAIQDQVEVNLYTKPRGYETVRYPLSGLVGTPQDLATTRVHNSAYYIHGTDVVDTALTTSLLNANVSGWLDGSTLMPGNPPAPLGNKNGIDYNYHWSLDAPNYTVFSNITSSTQWNLDHPGELTQAVELPHGEIHLAVGGIDVPAQNVDQIAGANGDMGENETAGLDPIFFFHHCNVDRIFWIWQVRHGSQDKLDIITKTASGDPYPGTNNDVNSNNGQQAPVGYEPGTILTMDSPLYPFKLVENCKEREYRSSDCFNIEIQLGLTYDNLYIDNHDNSKQVLEMIASASTLTAPAKKSDRILIVNGINRAKINGSFVIIANATINGVRYYLGSHTVLSRWNVTVCKNCQMYLEVTAVFSLHQFSDDELKDAAFDIEISGRRGNEAQFAKFTVTNEANRAKASRSGIGSFAAIKEMISDKFSAKADKKPFSLQVV